MPATPAFAMPLGRRFAPRPGEYRFTRRIERELRGSDRLVVERTFAVALAEENGGFHLAGQQSTVAVEAPAALQALADIERRRQEVALFPLDLDRSGLIVSGPGDSSSASPAVREAVDAAMAKLARDGKLASGDHAGFMQLVQSSFGAFLSRLPTDLFAPLRTEWVETREVAAGDGISGQVEIRFDASADPLTGLLQHASRNVLTRLHGTERQARESWSLERS